MVLIEPKSWSEAEDTDPTFLLHRVTFELTIVVRYESPRDRFEALDELMVVVRSALNGSTLGGGALSARDSVD